MDNFKKYTGTKDFLYYIKAKISVERDYLPQDLKDKVKEFEDYLQNYDVEKIRPQSKVISGDFFDIESIKECIQNETGYIWHVRELTRNQLKEHGHGDSVDYFEKKYNIKISGLRVFEFRRDARSRDEICNIDVFLMPGCACADIVNDRSSYGTDMAYSQSEFLKNFLIYK